MTTCVDRETFFKKSSWEDAVEKSSGYNSKYLLLAYQDINKNKRENVVFYEPR